MTLEMTPIKMDGDAAVVKVTVGNKSGVRTIHSDSSGTMEPAWMEQKAKQAWPSAAMYRAALYEAREACQNLAK